MISKQNRANPYFEPAVAKFIVLATRLLPKLLEEK